MKLYVFQVNNGSMLTFDTELAVQTVLDLKHAIQTKYKIATQHQVLVVNGGECMVAERRVCSYSAGMDTNPIFLFNKEMILCDRAPTIPKTTFSIENEMEMKVEESLMMPAVFHTVASRTQLAVEMFEIAKKLCSFCERLVHDEHLQHQGWAAIMANLDDCTTSYQKLLSKFDMAYTNYQQDFEDIKLKLTKLGTAVSVMAKIPLLECLTRHSYRESLEKSSSSTHPKTENKPNNEAQTSPQSAVLAPTEVLQDQKSPSSGESSSPGRGSSASDLQEALEGEKVQEETEKTDMPSFNVTLLDWINVQDRPNDVEAVVRKCFDSINRLDPRIIQPFLLECRDTITKLDNQNMKAIKGLEDRLYALDQMIASCKKLVNEQKELAQGFLANQMRAENLKDNSVLPDLCLSHANQLMIMLTNHRKLLDIKQKCTTAKQELANNLQVRLKWCCYVMLHADQNGEKLQALLRLLTELLERVRVVEALSTVPQIYCLAVVEVVRRKMFIKHYREWASALVKDGKNLYEAEKAKRETFGKLFRKSFLRNRLFRGLDSWPPSSFCTRKPRKFDFELPDISLNDLQYLKSCCPAEVQPFLRVPSLCDFEPLNHHTEALHQLVQAAQSVDEMSQTITDLLSELKVSGSQSPQRPSSEHRKETTPTPSKTPPPLSIQSLPTQPLSLPAPLEDLSPDSIDAHTFDFETIGHPNMDPVLQQGSLDLDSLAESPESDFMSAVNEFVIEGNVTSPNPISDPTSPEMMVESLYSSVINAIDNKRIQDTTMLERENSRIMALKLTIDKYRSAAEESQGNMRKVKDDLCHFQGLVLKEQRDFGFALKMMSAEIHSIINNIRRCQEEELGEEHQKELEKLKDDHEKHILRLTDELEGNHKIVRDVQRAMLELEGLVERKEKELAQMEGERERLLQEIRNSHQRAVQELERNLSERSQALQDALHSKDALASQLEGLQVEIEQKVRREMENVEKRRLQDLESRLKTEHEAQTEILKRGHQTVLDTLTLENQAKLRELTEAHLIERAEHECRFKDYEARISELADARCKLEVEMALKETETDDLRLQYEDAKTQQEEALKAEMEVQTKALQEQIEELMKQLQKKNEEHEQGLAELRTLMCLEKDHCISELVERHDEERALLRQEFSTLKQKSQDAEKSCEERLLEIQRQLEEQLKTLRSERAEEQAAFRDKEQDLQTTISDLQAVNNLLSGQLEKERKEARKTEQEGKEELKQALLQKEELEARLLGKITLLETQLERHLSDKAEAGHGDVGDASLQQRLDEERASLLGKLELLEKRKNEELQNLKTSLIAEQQTNFNTVLMREKLKKEQIIHELSEKLKMVTLQQEKDKSLIQTLSEDRATILQEKKHLEEELNRLRSSALVSSTFFMSNPVAVETPVACGPIPGEVPVLPVMDSERLASVAAVRDDDRVDSAVDASMMTVHDHPSMLSEEKQRILMLERVSVLSSSTLPIYATAGLMEVSDGIVFFSLTLLQTLHMKEEENKRLSQRLMSQSMSSVSSRHSEKIAIRDSRSYEATLGPGESHGKRILSGKKGAQNRFKVPLGTKFYRVKAVPWNKKV
ncbi:RB1-inducible coiled-coil protein 1 [Bagarius yarrelli]|uniref:RB1-inducible coiled-coil protein 1 n=1 Tax=Bagarius yarrelli TaxID=175774 RepID=A0A556U1J0_BAGYA|nr:RB1-inducible coiled-coil protein 1 [Bagarius yarrelli]